MRVARNKVTGLGEVMSTRNRSVMLQAYNKSWHVGDKQSVFFPIFWNPEYEEYYDEDGNLAERVVEVQEVDTFGKPVYAEDGSPVMTERGRWDIVAASIWGHVCNDMKATKLPSFIPSLTEIYDRRPVKFQRDAAGDVVYDTNGDPVYEEIEGDVTYQFSKIAPVFIHGRKAAEIKKASDRKWPTPEMLREKLNDIEQEYDTSKNMFAPKPVIGSLTYYASTEVVVVPLNDKDEYMTDKAAVYSYGLNSRERNDKLLEIINDVKFRPRDLSAKFIEIQLTYSGTSDDTRGRAEASRKASPIGLTPEYTIQQRNPVAYQAVKNVLSRLPEDSQLISHRNYSFRKKTEGEIMRALQTYVATNVDDLAGATEESDMAAIKRNISKLVDYNVLSMIPDGEVKTAMEESYAEWKSAHEESDKPVLVTQQHDYVEPKMDVPPTAQDLLLHDVDQEVDFMENLGLGTNDTDGLAVLD